jgi:curved DNA-binding protein CbpA
LIAVARKAVQSPFEVLGVDPGADEDEIRRAYRQRAKETHPDQGGTRRQFRLVKTAYEKLSSGGGRDWDEVGSDEEGETLEETESHVEYLDHDVVVDHGWSLDDDDLFAKASRVRLDDDAHGSFVVEGDDSVLEAAENAGFDWPFSCRGGACANCAVAVVDGEMDIFHDHVLPEELTERGIQLSCIGTPATSEMQLVFNIKHLPELEEHLLPPRPN